MNSITESLRNTCNWNANQLQKYLPVVNLASAESAKTSVAVFTADLYLQFQCFDGAAFTLPTQLLNTVL